MKMSSGTSRENSINYGTNHTGEDAPVDGGNCSIKSESTLLNEDLPSPQEAVDAAAQFSHTLFFKQENDSVRFLKYQRARSPWALFLVAYLYLSWLLSSLYFSWLLYHYTPVAVMGVLLVVAVSVLPGAVILLLPFIINFLQDQDFERRMRRYLLPRLETTWLMGTCTCYALGLIVKVSIGKCEDSSDIFKVLACDTEMEGHKLSEDYALLICIMPALLSMVLKGVDWCYVLIAWIISVVVVLGAVEGFDRHLSLSAVLVAFPVPLLILFENRRQSILTFLLEQKHRIVLMENTNMAQEIQANELRHMIGNVAHDLKTPLSGFMSGMEYISSIVKDLEKYFYDDCDPTQLTVGDRDYISQSLRSISSSTSNVRSIHTFMIMTINRCLDYTKASRGLKLVPHFETINVEEVISLPMFCMREMQSRIRLDMKPLPRSMCSFIITDLQWFQENILCLLSNAVKYSSKGMVSLQLSMVYRSDLKEDESSQLQDQAMKNFRQSSAPSGKLEVSGEGEAANLINTDSCIANAAGAVSGGANNLDTEAAKKKYLKRHMGYLALPNGDESAQFSARGMERAAATAVGDMETTAAATATMSQSKSIGESNEERMILIEVEDMGIGMSDETRAALFNPFKQAQRMAGGTGLGLFSLARRVEALNGRYGVRTRRDGEQGSNFWFTIPYRPDLEQEKLAIAEGGEEGVLSSESDLRLFKSIGYSTAMNPSAGVATGRRSTIASIGESGFSATPRMVVRNIRKLRQKDAESTNSKESQSKVMKAVNGNRLPRRSLFILLVDDSLPIQKMSSMLLSRAGHTVVVAENGADALDVLKDNANEKEFFDVILMDIHMPVMDGIECTRRLRQEEATMQPQQHTIVIGVSANSDTETRDVGLAAGLDDFISKPFTMDAFSTAFDRNAERFGAPGLFAATAEPAVRPNISTASSPSKRSAASSLTPSATAAASAKDAVVERLKSPTAVVNSAGSVQSLPPLKVLIVDDSISIQKMSGMMLKRKGHNVEVAGDGDDGVTSILSAWDAGAPFEVVLMDCQMPRMSGWDATAIVRQREIERQNALHHCIIGVSASSDHEVVENGYKSGIDKFMAKPFSYEGFARAYMELNSKQGSTSAFASAAATPTSKAATAANSNT